MAHMKIDQAVLTHAVTMALMARVDPLRAFVTAIVNQSVLKLKG